VLRADGANGAGPPEPGKGVDATVAGLGRRIREVRNDRLLTIQVLAERTGLSPSMLSLVERGKASPSIGTLVAISSALGVHMVDLLTEAKPPATEPVVRRGDQSVYVTANGVERRVLRADPRRGIEMVIVTFDPGTASTRAPTHHPGYEYGLVLDGKLNVDVANKTNELRSGDCIAYDSTIPHRLYNAGRRAARALWINVGRA
jgi:transcriptional regulator with XRE-family HTH domain